MSRKLEITDFLREATDIPIVDVRTPGEFSQGHIPGAVNIPLFSDQERKEIGTIYKQTGREEAILTGLKAAGPNLVSFVEHAKSARKNNRLLVHCWRGGMRSQSMAWLFETSGISTKTLSGGYKSFRNYVLEYFKIRFNLIILGGYTGSGKSEILRTLGGKEEQVLDLEAHAHHKGSAFGGLGENPQNSNEQFENDLFMDLYSKDPGRIIWIEDESNNIGRNLIPSSLFSQMRTAPVIFLEIPKKVRIGRLVDDYSSSPPEELMASIEKISKRLGGLYTKRALEFIRTGDFEGTADIALNYYDKSYLYGLEKREPSKVSRLALTDLNNITEITDLLLNKSRSLLK